MHYTGSYDLAAFAWSLMNGDVGHSSFFIASCRTRWVQFLPFWPIGQGAGWPFPRVTALPTPVQECAQGGTETLGDFVGAGIALFVLALYGFQRRGQ